MSCSVVPMGQAVQKEGAGAGADDVEDQAHGRATMT